MNNSDKENVLNKSVINWLITIYCNPLTNNYK